MEEKIREKDMTPILLEDLGIRFTSDTKKYKARYGIYQCQYCNKEFKTKIQSVKQGNTKSCGCQSDKYKNPHGKAYHPLYRTWDSMYRRCYNPKNPHYKNYGERGIQVCNRWLDINNFIGDMYPIYQEGLTLDRIDVDGNYCPENCRWATREVQNRNNRHLRITNTSGFRGVSWHKKVEKWVSKIVINNKNVHLGSYLTALEAGKAYETYVRLNNLEHNFTPALTEEEIEELNKKEGKC